MQRCHQMIGWIAVSWLWLVVGAVRPIEAQQYDPLQVSSASIKSIELTVHDSKRSRDVPVRVYLPNATDGAGSKSQPVVLFSHGLGGSRDNNAYLGNHLAGRGYVAVFMQHPGSDENVWKNTPLLQRRSALQSAASGKNLTDRCNDVHVVLDQLEEWNRQSDHPLFGRLDLKRVGMSGHSFGAHTTQAVAGQSFPVVGPTYLDDRISAAVAYSPSAPAAGSPDKAFGSVKIPWLLMTGTQDDSPIGGQTPASRLKVFPGLPDSVPSYELVLNGAQHSAFGDRALLGNREQRNPNHHRSILAITTAFLDAYLQNSQPAQQWINSDSVRQVLQEKDRWQTKGLGNYKP